MNSEESRKMKEIPLVMVRDTLDDIPASSLPDPYSLRYYRKGDEQHWARIEASVGEFPSQESALEAFYGEFGEHLDEMEDRCLLLEDGQGIPVGTTTAWRGTHNGKVRGRVHWVAMLPEYQGRGLAKPLLSSALARLSELHGSAYLTTQTTSWRAVGLYLQYGFVPVMTQASCREGWEMMEKMLQRRIIS